MTDEDKEYNLKNIKPSSPGFNWRVYRFIPPRRRGCGGGVGTEREEEVYWEETKSDSVFKDGGVCWEEIKSDYVFKGGGGIYWEETKFDGIFKGGGGIY